MVVNYAVLFDLNQGQKITILPYINIYIYIYLDIYYVCIKIMMIIRDNKFPLLDTVVCFNNGIQIN